MRSSPEIKARLPKIFFEHSGNTSGGKTSAKPVDKNGSIVPLGFARVNFSDG
jgi:hypothetical protein